MKKISKALLFIAVSAMAAVSCAKENIQPTQSGETQMVTFNATAVETKTVFGEKSGNSYPTLWTTNEQVAVSYNGGELMTTDITPSSDDKSASFTLGIGKEAGAQTHKFVAVSPAASVTDVDKQDNSFYVYIPSTQTPLSGSCEEKAQLIAASKEYSDEEFDNHVELNFKHIPAYGNMSVLLPSDAGTVESVSLSADYDLTGHFNYSFSNDELFALDAVKTVTIKTNKTDGLFFAVAPVDLSGKKMTVTVTTNKGVYTKEIDLSGKTLKFVVGQVSKFAVSGFTQSATRSEAWTLVTDASTLAAGDKLVIASNDKGAVAGDISSKKFMTSLGNAKFSSDKASLVELPSDAVILTLGGTVDSWTLTNENAEKLGGSNSAGNVYWNSGITTWKITIDSKYGATIQVSTSTSTNRFLYNVNYPRFLTYSSATSASMLLPQLYRLSSNSALVAPANVKAVVDGQIVTVTWDVVSGAKDYTVTCTGQTEQTVSGTTCSFENLDYDTEYTVSVVANPEDASVSKSVASTAIVKTGENPNPYLTVTPSEYKDEIPAAGAELKFTVKTNQPSWTVTSTDETNFKPSILSDNSGFTVTVAANDGNARTATITISAGNASDVVLELAQQAYKSEPVIIYSATFEDDSEHRTSGNTSYTSNTYTVGDVKWTLKYSDAVTSGNPLADKAHIIARVAKNTSNQPVAITDNILSRGITLSKMTFLAKLGTNLVLSVSYSTDNTTWIELTCMKDTNVDKNNGYSVDMKELKVDKFYLKFNFNSTGIKAGKSNIDSNLDNVIIYGL